MIKNIICDMGNVLMSYNPEVPLAWYFDREEDRAIIRQELFGGPEWIEGDRGTLPHTEKFAHIHKRVPERLHEGLKACIEGWQESMKPFPHAQDFVQEMKQRGHKVFVLSNANEEFYTYFPRFGDLAMWDGIVVSSDIKIIKPDARIYQYILDKYALVPAECLFLDDVEANVLAAREMGIQAEVFRGDFEVIKEKYHL